jgi:glycyl-tRNA synthetase beta chain
MPEDLLLEIGCEELPASFVAQATQALPGLVASKLVGLRLAHGPVRALGTPRRLAVFVRDLADHQPDLDEQVLGPPVRVAFDAQGQPTKACLAFTGKLGCAVSDLTRVDTPKGEYLAGRRREQGTASVRLLPGALAEVCGSIPFRKSMRWSDGDTAFGRPVRWIVALYGKTPLDFTFAAVRTGSVSYGHRFLSAEPITLSRPVDYVDALRAHHVLVDTEERQQVMLDRLRKAAITAGGELIEDAFLVEENASLVEEPQVIVGGFEPEFLSLPEGVILSVAKGHQRYFGVRTLSGTLLPKYLAVCNTALYPDNVRRGNDRVMRARLADAKFFFGEDRKQPLGARRPALDGIVFHQRLGTVGDKVRRMEQLVEPIGRELGLSESVVEQARRGAALSKCDLATLMVGELPELQGEMGRAYALAGGETPAVADVIRDHYLPRGADHRSAQDSAHPWLGFVHRGGGGPCLPGVCRHPARPRPRGNARQARRVPGATAPRTPHG